MASPGFTIIKRYTYSPADSSLADAPRLYIVCYVFSSGSDIEAPKEGYDDSTPGDSKTTLERAATLLPRFRGFDLGKELSSFSSCIINPSEAARAGGSSSTPQCPRT